MPHMGSYHHTQRRPLRSSTVVISLFVVAVLALAYLNEPMLVSRVQHISLTSLTTQKRKHKFPFPDFDKYVHTQTLSPESFGLGAPDERVIVIGDTHGMNRSFHNLLSTVHYNPHKDTLFLTGDILAKSTEAGSLALLDFFAGHRRSGCAHISDGPPPSSESRKTCKSIYAVRGNHDQMIVQWRAWREWFERLQLTFPSAHLHPRLLTLSSLTPFTPLASTTTSASYDAGPPVGTGSQFLALIESEWLSDRTTDPTGAGSDSEEWVDTARKRARGTWREEWWRRIPQPGKGRTSKDFIMFGDHYWIARDMTPEHAEFLYSLPLVIHVPSEHFYVVHGGLLPSDPRHPSNDERQPLAHPPSADDDDDNVSPDPAGDYEYPLLDIEPQQRAFPRLASNYLDDEIEVLRVVQERSVLQEVPQNRDAWSILNMRGIRKGGKVTRRGDKGTPWAKIWNGQMKRCVGFENVTAPEGSSQEDEYEREKEDGEAAPLPCYPATVVYGHAASRDLDVRRWTVGLDTGCLYGRRLTALVLTRSEHDAHAHHHGPTPTSPADDDDDEGDEEDESSEEEEDEDEFAFDGPFEGVNARFARVGGGSVISRTRKPKTWTRKIRFGDHGADVEAKLVSIKCPKVADLS